MFRRFILLLVFTSLNFFSVKSLSAEWTQYSDSASLPMSKKYRDNLREKLERVDVNSLGEADRLKVANLLRLLSDSEDYITEVDEIRVKTPSRLFVFVLLAAVGYYVYKKVTRTAYIPDVELIRQAREAKYQ